jgi:nicotinate-nucleotide adenylyltransferase
MKIAILGGSFDPPHKGHVLLSKQLLKTLMLDQIVLMPCFQHPFNKNLSPAGVRFKMAKFLEEKSIGVSDLEIKKKRPSYSIETLVELSKNNPGNAYNWIIGVDQVKDFMKWKEWKRIIDNFGLIIVPRKTTDNIELYLSKMKKQIVHPENIVVLNEKSFSPINISSTEIRKKIQKNKSISNLVPKGVEKYIIQRKLYR